MGLHRKKERVEDARDFLNNLSPEQESIFEERSRKAKEEKQKNEPEKLPKPVKPRKADTRKELDEATEKMLAAFAKLNDRITEINTGLAEQKTVLEKLVKTDEEVHKKKTPESKIVDNIMKEGEEKEDKTEKSV